MKRLIFFCLALLIFSPVNAQNTMTWAVYLEPGADPDAIAAQMGVENLGQIGSLEGIYLFRATNSRSVVTESVQGVLEVQPQIGRLREPRVTFTDPLYPNQWHLSNTGQGGGVAGEDINVMGAWDAGFDGTGLVVASVDDGVWHQNPDISPNYLASASWDYINNDNDPSGGGHGTSVAGVMAADNDGAACGVGVAYNAQVAGLRIPFGGQTDAQEAGALSHQYNTIHVYNSSWGPSDSGQVLEGPGPLTEAAMLDGITNGRGGLGAIYVWAAGNGRSFGDNVNADGYANSIYVITVGATTNSGTTSYYSERGSSLLINAPSNGGSAGITTTAGNTGGCTSGFGGTSSAAPAAAGVIALMLQANPNLTWRDVQHILVRTADQNNPADADWTTNGAGYHVNHNYGFGRIDATEAVTLAQTWENVLPMSTYTSSVSSKNVVINGEVSDTITVPQNFVVEHAEVIFNAAHEVRGEVEVNLTSPSGTLSRLMEPRQNDNSPEGFNNWRMSSVRHWGEASTGDWTLTVRDTKPENTNTGTFESWQLLLHGYYQVAPVELITNGGFEEKFNGWKRSGFGVKDGIAKDTLDKRFAHEGSRALILKGKPGENSAVIQPIDVSTLAANDVLTLSAYVRTKNLATGARLRLVVRYDGLTPDKPRIRIPAGTAPYSIVSGFVTLKAPPRKVVAKILYTNPAATGRLYVDDVSLTVQPANVGLLALPPAQ